MCGPVNAVLLYLYHLGTYLLLEFRIYHVFENRKVQLARDFRFGRKCGVKFENVHFPRLCQVLYLCVIFIMFPSV